MTLYDLTRQVEDGMPTYPGDPEVRVTPHATADADGYRVTALELGTHAGTHVDAPSHVLEDGATLGEFDLDTFRFGARVVDVPNLGPRGVITPEAVPDAGVDLVLFHTGWDEHWGTDRYREHPYLSREAAERCARRGLAVGLDCFSPDPTPDPNAEVGGGGQEEDDHDRRNWAHGRRDDYSDYGAPAHRALLGAELLVFENLVGLGRLPERCTVSAFPLRVDADGAPARVVAETGTRGAE
ncbi:cyclase family protein [Halorarum halophilum]|uniref:Cyclase family protein n=1 Tax=Halorarum halophilum TaxID=2743090 RepID=A0A7D5KWG3_9EURY|nr:cyclase family protein [Halobaculum halophilum]QLG26598.1 cyclase family protein [Halobaculum halophilum]